MILFIGTFPQFAKIPRTQYGPSSHNTLYKRQCGKVAQTVYLRAQKVGLIAAQIAQSLNRGVDLFDRVEVAKRKANHALALGS